MNPGGGQIDWPDPVVVSSEAPSSLSMVGTRLGCDSQAGILAERSRFTSKPAPGWVARPDQPSGSTKRRGGRSAWK